MGLIQRIVAGLLGVLFIAAVFVFASLVLGALLAIGLAAWGWLWWRARGKLRHARQEGVIVEGEYHEVSVAQIEELDRPVR